MSTLETMYPAQANSPETSLSGALTAAGTSVTVNDGSVLPSAPNLLTIGADSSAAETVLMTAKSGNVLTITRAQNGTTARAWVAGSSIGRYFTAADQTAIQNNITKLNEEKAEKVSSPTSGDFAGLDSSGNLTDSGKKAADFADASHSHSGYAQVLIFSSVAVAASAWASDSTYADFPYAATITLTGVTSSYVPEVNFDCTNAASGNFAPVALSGSGTIKVYAAEKPTAAITIQSITCIKAV
jgi:hypothetical protein